MEPSDAQSSEDTIDTTSVREIESSLLLFLREAELPRAVKSSLRPVILTISIL